MPSGKYFGSGSGHMIQIPQIRIPNARWNPSYPSIPLQNTLPPYPPPALYILPPLPLPSFALYLLPFSPLCLLPPPLFTSSTFSTLYLLRPLPLSPFTSSALYLLRPLPPPSFTYSTTDILHTLPFPPCFTNCILRTPPPSITQTQFSILYLILYYVCRCRGGGIVYSI